MAAGIEITATTIISPIKVKPRLCNGWCARKRSLRASAAKTVCLVLIASTSGIGQLAPGNAGRAFCIQLRIDGRCHHGFAGNGLGDQLLFPTVLNCRRRANTLQAYAADGGILTAVVIAAAGPWEEAQLEAAASPRVEGHGPAALQARVALVGRIKRRDGCVDDDCATGK